jgi:hypothetical protein
MLDDILRPHLINALRIVLDVRPLLLTLAVTPRPCRGRLGGRQ